MFSLYFVSGTADAKHLMSMAVLSRMNPAAGIMDPTGVKREKSAVSGPSKQKVRFRENWLCLRISHRMVVYHKKLYMVYFRVRKDSAKNFNRCCTNCFSGPDSLKLNSD